MTTSQTDSPAPPELAPREKAILQSYWRRNLRLMGLLLLVWAGVSLGCGILLADVLNAWDLPGTGYPLGFWFAQQGSILTFVGLILIYALAMNRLDRIHHEERAALIPPEAESMPFRGDGI